MKETKINISAFQVSEGLSFHVRGDVWDSLGCAWAQSRKGPRPCPPHNFPDTHVGWPGASGHVLWQQHRYVVQKKIMVWIMWIFLEMQILCWEALFPETLAVVGGSVAGLILCILLILLLSTVLEAVSFIAANFFLFLWFPRYTIIVKISCSAGVLQWAPSALHSLWWWNPRLPPFKSRVWCGDVGFSL